MGDVIKISDRIYKWREVYFGEDDYSSVRIYVNTGTGELEIVSVANDGTSIRTYLSTVASVALGEQVTKAHAALAGTLKQEGQ